MVALPDEILDGIAARPVDVAAWEVLTDFLLENELPGATLARCDLELLRGISNPELLEALAVSRKQRPRLPFEPSAGYDAQWRCGYVTRLRLDADAPDDQLVLLLAAPAVRGLHHLLIDDALSVYRQRQPPATWLEQRVERALAAVTPHLRRCSVTLGSGGAPPAARVKAVLEALVTHLPKQVERVDLSAVELPPDGLPALATLARRVKTLDLDGTRLTELPLDDLQACVEAAPGCTFLFGGTWRSPRDWEHPRVAWFSPEAIAWLEHEDTGVVIPLSPRHAHDGFSAPAWPGLQRWLTRELLGWSSTPPGGRGRLPLDDGAELELNGLPWRFHLRRR